MRLDSIVDREPADIRPFIIELTERLAPGVEVLHRLGEGGMGVVFLARDVVLRRPVAIKLLAPALAENQNALTRFMREAQAAAAVAHPNIVAVYHVDTLPRSGTPFFLMQFIEGHSLEDRLTEGQAVAESTARRVVGEVASALAAAHARGLVHRDIKPNNIMIERDSGRAMVVDFGISAAVNKRVFGDASDLTEHGTYIGTPRYTSPEQAAGLPVSHPSDVYSLGIVAFRLLVGKLPFDENSAIGLLAAHLKDAPPKVATVRPDIDRRFAELVDRCLAKEPATRPTAAEMASYLIPPPQHALPWPPPGLERLRGAGARVAASVGRAVFWSIVFLLLISATPTRSSTLWFTPEQSEFWSWVQQRVAWLQSARAPSGSSMSSAAGDATPIWIMALVLVASVVVATSIAAAVRASGLAGVFRHSRRAGYPWPVLFDVAWDYRSDTGALLNGTGDYALIPREQRERLLGLRRAQRTVVVATLVAVVSVAALWLTGILGWRDAHEPILVVSAETTTFLVLVLVGVLGIVGTTAPEARVRAAGRGWRDLIGSSRRHVPHSGIVAEWLRRRGLQSSVSSSRARSMAPVVAIVPIILVGTITAVVMTLLLISVSTAERTNRARMSAETWLSTERYLDPRNGSERPGGRAGSIAPMASMSGRRLALMADPESPPGLDLIADTTVSASERLELIRAIGPAFCLSPREIAFGVDIRRRELMRRAAEAFGGGSTPAVTISSDWLERWIRTPVIEGTAYTRESPALLRALGWVGLPGIQARLAFCRASP